MSSTLHILTLMSTMSSMLLLCMAAETLADFASAVRRTMQDDFRSPAPTAAITITTYEGPEEFPADEVIASRMQTGAAWLLQLVKSALLVPVTAEQVQAAVDARVSSAATKAAAKAAAKTTAYRVHGWADQPKDGPAVVVPAKQPAPAPYEVEEWSPFCAPMLS
jgi:hypothetical protein